MNLYQKIMAGLCFPLDVIWKHHMGARYCNWPKLILVTIAFYYGMGYFTIFFMADDSMLNPKIAHFIPAKWHAEIFQLAFLAMLLTSFSFGVANILEIRRRKKAGVQLHSYYIGTPRFLPDRPFVHTFVIPVGSFLAGLALFQIVRPIGIYVCVAAVFQRWIFKSIFKQEHTREMDRQDRELLNEWKSGVRQTMPTGHVQVVKPQATQNQADEAAFNQRWKKVLKPPDSQTK